MLKSLFVGFSGINGYLHTVYDRCAYKWHVVVIALLVNFSPVFAQAVNEPCFVEIRLLTPWQELSELSDSNLKFRKLFFQDSINHHFFGGPFGGDWIKTFQLGEDFCMEGRSGLVKSGFSVSPIGDVTAKNSRQNGTDNFFKIVYEKFKHRVDTPFDSFWWFVIFPLSLMPLWIPWIFPKFYFSRSDSD